MYKHYNPKAPANHRELSKTCIIPPGMPEYIASGSHMFKNERYRFLILKRYQRDLHSLIKNKRVNPKSIPVIACQILDVLEHLHDQGYVHSDIKAENLMIGTVEGTAQNGASRSSSGQNGTDYQSPEHRSNGVTLAEGKVAKRGTKASAEHQQVNGASGTNAQENGLYFHQEQEMCTRTRNLRPLKTVTYRDLSDEDERSANTVRSRGNYARKRGRRRQDDVSFSCSISPRRSGYEELKAATEEAHWHEMKRAALPKATKEDPMPAEDRIHLIDFGLASKFVDSSGQHRPFCMDQRRAHDGTLEFTSRDAHMGAHARRSDLECLGYNLVYWSRGFLPWKDEKLLNQPEQVHRMKEYFMTDVHEMLRLIYGEDCPGYLGDFLAYVGSLTYDDRPDYQYCKSLFYKELKRLGCPVSRSQPLQLDVNAIVQLSEPLTAQDEAEITNKINHVKSLMKMGALIPYRESTLHSKASSPKNLRSKRSDVNGRNLHAAAATTVTDGAAVSGASLPNATTPAGSMICTRKKEKQFSFEEIFATDADQIARERVEKEFERAEQMEETVIRYSGRPTYAIQELLERKSRGHSLGGGLEYTESEGYIKGYTKPMMDILRKRQSQLLRDIKQMNSTEKDSETNKLKCTEARNRQGVKKEERSDSENAPTEQDSDPYNEGEDEKGETVDTPMGNDYEDEDDVSVKLSKYEQDDDYELASEEEDEEDFVDDDDDEKDVQSEEEEEDVEDDDEEVDEEYGEEEEEEDVEPVVQNGYESRGSYRRKKESKSRKKEDTDSDFINDGGCEVEGTTDISNLPDGDEEMEENEEEQQDSDFNDQDSTATGSDVVIPEKPKRKRGRPRKTKQKVEASSDRKSKKAPNGKTKRTKSDAKMLPGGIHDNEEEASYDGADDSYGRKVGASKQRSGHRQKRQRVLDDGDGDNARLCEDQLDTESRLADGHVTVRKRNHHYNNNNHCNSKAYYGDVDDSSHDMAPPNSATGDGGLVDRNASKYSSGTRQSGQQHSSTTAVPRSRKRTTVTDNDTGHSNNRWSPSNSNGSQSAATSRSSSVSAPGNGSGTNEYSNLPQRLATLPEHQEDYVEEDDGDDTRDVDYSPVCTRRRRKATVGLEAAANGTMPRKTSSSTTIRKRNESKGVIGKGTGSAAPPPPPPPSSSSGSAVNGDALSLPPAYGSSASIPRKLDVIQPPPAPVAAAALIQHHHQQQQRIRRPQHHMAYQNYYRVNEQHHLPSTMLVRTYSRG
uniref:non-specific serine/threonine protein kinase n=1 Tax=Anopheles culicifacies TaxID=139723 RepID=A0A182LU08_9DIPT